mmetsp:Transcript_78831/g.255702  ORF Transcript_78831/g.255702 Transcript_78831/m.255702 type:complete len:211 (-) Transcript_78831:1175-1807(-)
MPRPPCHPPPPPREPTPRSDFSAASVPGAQPRQICRNHWRPSRALHGSGSRRWVEAAPPAIWRCGPLVLWKPPPLSASASAPPSAPRRPQQRQRKLRGHERGWRWPPTSSCAWAARWRRRRCHALCGHVGLRLWRVRHVAQRSYPSVRSHGRAAPSASAEVEPGPRSPPSPPPPRVRCPSGPGRPRQRRALPKSSETLPPRARQPQARRP